MKLVSADCVETILKEDRFAKHHAANHGFLGTGMIYYALAYSYQAKVCVCLGSGSGFVPKLMRQAQRDLGIEGRTILIDANMKGEGWGGPDYYDGPCHFTENFDVEIIKERTLDAVKNIEVRIDYLHIDADHSYRGVRADFEAYWPLLGFPSVVTFHDTLFPRAGVGRFVEELKRDGAFGVALLDIGQGIAIVNRRRKMIL